MGETYQIPGFTADQTWALRQVIREEMTLAVKPLVAEDRTPCKRVAELADTVTRLEERMHVLMWLAALALTTSASAAVTVLVKVVF